MKTFTVTEQEGDNKISKEFLGQLQIEIDRFLESETKESLIEWINSRRNPKPKEDENELWQIVESYFKDILSDKPFKERVELRQELSQQFSITKKQLP